MIPAAEASLTHDEIIELFGQLLPGGLCGPVARKLAMAEQGWDKSPYYCLWHPTPEQEYHQAHKAWEREFADREFYASLDHKVSPVPPNKDDYLIPERLAASKAKRQKAVDDLLAGFGLPDGEFEKEYPTKTKITDEDEIAVLMGKALITIFCNQYDVRDSFGNEICAGTWRGLNQRIADFGNQHLPSLALHYLNSGSEFYTAETDLADPLPLVTGLFLRCKEAGLQWAYRPSQLSMINLGEVTTESDQMEGFVEEINEQSAKAQAAASPPLVVRAYQAAYGVFPPGWPA